MCRSPAAAAMVNRTFTSSMEVGVRVEEECVRTGARHHCCRCVKLAVMGFGGGEGYAQTSGGTPAPAGSALLHRAGGLFM